MVLPGGVEEGRGVGQDIARVFLVELREGVSRWGRRGALVTVKVSNLTSTCHH